MLLLDAGDALEDVAWRRAVLVARVPQRRGVLGRPRRDGGEKVLELLGGYELRKGPPGKQRTTILMK